MKIDKNVERAVRKALAGAVAGEDERFDSAVVAISRAGDVFASNALDLAVRINRAALFSLHKGQRPTDEQLRVMAQEFADEEEEDWAHIDADTTLKYLKSLAELESPVESLSLAQVMFASFAIGGWLLSAFIPEDSSVHWNDFLDQILDKLESTPAT